MNRFLNVTLLVSLLAHGAAYSKCKNGMCSRQAPKVITTPAPVRAATKKAPTVDFEQQLKAALTPVVKEFPTRVEKICKEIGEIIATELLPTNGTPDEKAKYLETHFKALSKSAVNTIITIGHTDFITLRDTIVKTFAQASGCQEELLLALAGATLTSPLELVDASNEVISPEQKEFELKLINALKKFNKMLIEHTAGLAKALGNATKHLLADKNTAPEKTAKLISLMTKATLRAAGNTVSQLFKEQLTTTQHSAPVYLGELSYKALCEGMKMTQEESKTVFSNLTRKWDAQITSYLTASPSQQAEVQPTV